EFSHVLHGDMRLNIRMIGVLAGIVFIGSIGRFAMRAVGRGGGGRKNGAAAVFAAGLALFIIGYTGLFFARLIKASIARQREFLADASSVQYTRNPDGIAGALDQIGASARGALIESRSAEELSHMFFGESVKLWFSGIFATHPPLEERIRRVHPGFLPSQYRSRRAPPAPQLGEDDERRRKAAEGVLATAVLAAGGKRAADAEHAWGRSPQASAQLVGALDADKVDKAQRLLATLPEALRAAVQQSAGARAAVLALLAPQAGAARIEPALHLPLVDLALPALKQLDLVARNVFLGEVESAIRADRRVSLHEFVLLALLRHQLAPPAPVAGGKRIEALRGEALALLSLIAYAGHADAAAAFNAGVAQLGLRDAALVPRPAITLEAAGAALDRLRGLAPLAKALLVKAMFAVASFDGTIRLGESELLRLAGAVLDCPLPPLFD
ncbi:MAG: M48 family metalloprotease, partial [Betaproteobacteria bacterium]|nr:M48 family metalloprotease [Betaproteobacteria bacterium]